MKISWLAGICAALITTPALAQVKWPERQVTLMVGFAAGGPIDTIARNLADGLSAKWGQPVVVENRPGGNGVVANLQVKQSPPDGYRLLIANAGGTVIKPAVDKNMPYDALKDFTPIGLLADYPYILVSSTDAPFNSVAELVAYAKKNPEAVTYSSAAVAGANHVGMELFKILTGTEMRHIPYNGDAPTIPDLLTGRVTTGLSSVLLTLPLIKEKKLKALGISSLERSELAPEIPTIAETMPELAGFSVTPFAAIMGPAGMSKELVAQINADVNSVIGSPAVKAKLSVLANTARPGTPEQLRELMIAELKKWRATAERAKIAGE